MIGKAWMFSPKVFSLRNAAIGAGYLGGYVLLDRISFIDPVASYGITPWNPPTGLSFALVLLFGRRFIPLLFVAPALADLTNRDEPLGWPLELVVTTIIGAGYTLALMFLMRPSTRFNPALLAVRDLFLLLAAAAVSATLVALSYVGAIVIADVLPDHTFGDACLRFWIGDMIGIAVVTPLLLVVLTRDQFPKLSLELAAQILVVAIVLAIVLGVAQSDRLQLFYVLFLPIVWIAVRTGLEGVTVGILLAQIGLILGGHALPANFDLTTFQAQMLVLTITGLMAGALVSERRRTELQLRLHQESLARHARLGSMGELAATIAHEINQPLMAAGTYGRLVVDALARDGRGDPSIAETASKAAAQVERASKVIKRLRALVRLDESERAPTRVERIFNEVLELCQPDLNQAGIVCETSLTDDLPLVMVDLLQVEQVLLNVMRNSIDAIRDGKVSQGVITVEARPSESGEVEIRVHDSGPGFPVELLAGPLPPFSTTKVEGLGVGLALSRTIVEKHGGELTLGSDLSGAIVRFTLPAVNAHG